MTVVSVVRWLVRIFIYGDITVGYGWDTVVFTVGASVDKNGITVGKLFVNVL
jgi:hypothetical protein